MARLKYFIMASLLILMSVITWNRNSLYKTPLLLWQDTVKKSPNKARPHNNLGYVLKNLGDIDGAQHQFELSNQLIPDDPNVLNNLATIYSSRGRKAEAVKLLQKALVYEPMHKDARYNLALLYYQLGLVEEAKQECLLIIQYWPISNEAIFARQLLIMIENQK